VKRAVLFYDGGTYELDQGVVAELLERGVIVLDEHSGYYSLAPEHLIEEVEPDAKVLDRLTGSVARAQELPDTRTIQAEFQAPNGLGGRR
jgi:hypothetical protein